MYTLLRSLCTIILKFRNLFLRKLLVMVPTILLKLMARTSFCNENSYIFEWFFPRVKSKMFEKYMCVLRTVQLARWEGSALHVRNYRKELKADTETFQCLPLSTVSSLVYSRQRNGKFLSVKDMDNYLYVHREHLNFGLCSQKQN